MISPANMLITQCLYDFIARASISTLCGCGRAPNMSARACDDVPEEHLADSDAQAINAISQGIDISYLSLILNMMVKEAQELVMCRERTRPTGHSLGSPAPQLDHGGTAGH
jgi:hypothetical protein